MIKIVTDSACDLQSISQFAPGIAFSRVPLKILVGEKEFVDEPQLDVEQMMAEMYAFHGPSSSACPSPEDWARAFRDADEVYAITISGNISGSYSSAVAARQMVLEENPEKKIFLLNSFSAGAEMTLLVRKLCQLLNQGKPYEEVCLALAAYRKETKLLFLLSSLDNFVKNGRVSKVAGLTARMLNIRVIGQASDNGVLELLHKCRGESKALSTALKEMELRGYRGGRVVIGHTHNPQGAENLQALLRACYPQADISVMPMSGLCSYYAEAGGLLLGYEIAPAENSAG